MSNIHVTSGDAYTGDRRLTVTVTDEATGDPVDLTDVDLAFMVKRRVSDDDEDALVSKSTDDDIAITDASGGIARIALDEADTAGLGGRFYWELEADDAIGKVTLASGRFYVTTDLIEG